MGLSLETGGGLGVRGRYRGGGRGAGVGTGGGGPGAPGACVCGGATVKTTSGLGWEPGVPGLCPMEAGGTQTAALGDGEAAEGGSEPAPGRPPRARFSRGLAAPLELRRPCQRLNGAKRPPPSHWPPLPPVKPPAASPLAARPGRGRGVAGAAL